MNNKETFYLLQVDQHTPSYNPLEWEAVEVDMSNDVHTCMVPAYIHTQEEESKHEQI